MEPSNGNDLGRKRSLTFTSGVSTIESFDSLDNSTNEKKHNSVKFFKKSKTKNKGVTFNPNVNVQKSKTFVETVPEMNEFNKLLKSSTTVKKELGMNHFIKYTAAFLLCLLSALTVQAIEDLNLGDLNLSGNKIYSPRMQARINAYEAIKGANYQTKITALQRVNHELPVIYNSSMLIKLLGDSENISQSDMSAFYKQLTNQSIPLTEDLGDIKTSVADYHERQEKKIKQLWTAVGRMGGGLADTTADGRLQRYRTDSVTSFDHGAAFDHNAGDPDLKSFMRSGIQTKGLSSGDESGAFLVARPVQDHIQQRLILNGGIRSLARSTNISTDAIELLIDKNAGDVGWVSETGDRDETATPELFKHKIPVHEIYAKPRISQKLLDDAVINIESWLIEKVSHTMHQLENTAFVNGDGVGKPKGFMNYPLVAIGAGEWGKIESVKTGVSGAIIDLDALYYALEAMKPEIAGWSAITQLRRLKTNDGMPIWQPSIVLREPDLLLGYPVVVSDDMPKLRAGTPSTSIMLANFRKGYQVVDRHDMRLLRDPYSSKPFVEFYATKRVGGDTITLPEVKAHLRLDTDVEDDLLNNLVLAATNLVEDYLGKTLIKKTWRLVDEGIHTDGLCELALPRGPLLKVLVVQRILPNDTYVNARFTVKNYFAQPIIVFKVEGPVSIIYEAGYGYYPKEVPAPIRQALLTLVAHFYDSRAGQMILSPLVKTLLSPFREFEDTDGTLKSDFNAYKEVWAEIKPLPLTTQSLPLEAGLDMRQ
eukprot:gene20363-26429_t